MKLVSFLLFTLSLLLATTIETNKEAYKAYKRGEYKRAFELYKEANNPKAYYNLAQFYEHGIGTTKDKQCAAYYYRMVYNSIDFGNYKTCETELLPYYYITLKKLRKFSDYKKLKRLCKKERNPFIKQCPAAKNITRKYRTDIELFNCQLYKKFPKTMNKLLAIHTNIKQYDNLFESLLIKRYRKKIYHTIQPIVSYYIKRETHCIKRAYTNSDIQKCIDEYRAFLHSAYMSVRVTAGILPSREMLEKDPKLRAEIEAEKEAYRKRAAFLKQRAGRKEKEEALRKLKTLHKHVEYYYH